MTIYIPSRIIVGYPKIIDIPEFAIENAAINQITDVAKLQEAAKIFASLLKEGPIKKDDDTLLIEIQ